MKHEYAEILHAIADGKDIECQSGDGTWCDKPTNHVLRYISEGFSKDRFRAVKPKIKVNGITCNAPSIGVHDVCIEAYSHGDFLRETVLSFESFKDRDAVYEALIKPFEYS